MFYWLPETRTMVWWAIVIGLIWLTIDHPAQAGAVVGHLLHFLDWAAHQLAKFAESI